MNKIQLNEVVTPILDDLGYELWSCEFKPQGQLTQIQLYVDKSGEGAFSLDDCMKVARLLRPILDVEFDMRGQYHLEISSPGIHRRLHTVAQMQRYIGESVQVKLYSAIENRKQFKGILKAADEEAVTLADGDEVLNFPQADIAKINVIS